MGKLPTIRPIPPQPPTPPLNNPVSPFPAPPLPTDSGLLAQSFPSRAAPPLTANGGEASLTSFGTIDQRYQTLVVLFSAGVQGASAAQMQFRLAGDSSADYISSQSDCTDNAPPVPSGLLSATAGICGTLGAISVAGAGYGVIRIYGYADRGLRVGWTFESWRTDGSVPGNTHRIHGGGVWLPATAMGVTSITFIPSGGTLFAVNSRFDFYGE